MTIQGAESFAAGWCEAWNAHDLDRVIDHYAPEIEFSSPLARQLTGDANVKGVDALRRYWTEGLALNPQLRFEVADVFVGEGNAVIVYRDHHDRKVAETFTFGADGKVVRASACYGPASGSRGAKP